MITKILFPVPRSDSSVLTADGFQIFRITNTVPSEEAAAFNYPELDRLPPVATVTLTKARRNSTIIQPRGRVAPLKKYIFPPFSGRYGNT